MDRFNHEMAAHAWAHAVPEQFLGGMRSGVNGTPTFFVNGVRHTGVIDALPLRSAIENADKVEQRGGAGFFAQSRN